MAIDYRREFGGFLERLARESGDIIRGYFGRPADALGVESKADGTPVTLADREAEERMRALIRAEHPAHGIVAEEFGSENAEAEFTWVLDPIDGTISFACGCPLFGTLIGLMHRGQPVLGAIHQPVTGQLCMGDNVTTTLNGRAVRLRRCERLADATLLATDVAHIAAHRDAGRFEALRREVRLFRTWGDCFGYLLVAAGGADIMLDPVLNPWDLLPLIPVIRGAGGAISGWDGGDPVSASSCIATNPRLHPQVLEWLGSRPAAGGI